ncbi:SixA phosphatase family protein [Micromonospora sp. KLBMP9576]|uniref:SixA phosphatase family protein n=1 Tax=Micromonospora sp. KLBMP9576 TaxID=3424769 RepID=UPI003D8D9AD5
MTDADTQGRTLVLLRHARAELPGETPDVRRPLSARGRADAAAAGGWLARHDLLPDVVVCSAARRTRETWHDVAMGMTGSPTEGGSAGPAPVVRYEADAYEADPEDLLTLLRSVDPAARTVLLIAHNPGISLLSALLDPERADQNGMRTSDVVVHRLSVDWPEIGPRKAPISDRHTARG